MAGYIPRWYTRPKTITHPSTNRARRALTSFTRQTPLTTTPRRQPKQISCCRRIKKSSRSVWRVLSIVLQSTCTYISANNSVKSEPILMIVLKNFVVTVYKIVHSTFKMAPRNLLKSKRPFSTVNRLLKFVKYYRRTRF